MIINHCYQFNLALSHGAYAWPGGYPIYFVTADGCALSFESAQENAGLIRDAIIAGARTGNDEWRIVASDINWEDTELTCDHSGEKIQSAYGENEAIQFCAGWNMPGYMPDCEPCEFSTFDDAKRYIISELKREEEEAESEDEAETLAAFAEDVNLQSSEFGTTCGKYHYFVTKV